MFNRYCRLPMNAILRLPSGAYAFVGRVSADLGFERKVDGSTPTPKELEDDSMLPAKWRACRDRCFESKEALIAFAQERGYTWSPDGGPDGSMVKPEQAAA